MDDALRERVDALERAVTDGDCDFTALTDEAEAIERLEAVETQLDDLEDRVAELEAATQALRGYAGNIRSVNRDVEQRADTALAKAREIEQALDDSSEHSRIATETTPRAATADSAESTANASVDGGMARTPPDQTEAKHRCQACGRLHDETFSASGTDTLDGHQHQSSRQSIDTATDRTDPDSHTETQSTVTDTGQEELPETTEETGTLQRVREML